VYLTEEQKHDTIKSYDMRSHQETILSQSPSSIAHCHLRDGHILLWCTYEHKQLVWYENRLDHEDPTQAVKTEVYTHVRRSSGYPYVLLPKSEGYLAETHICSRSPKTCFWQIIKHTPSGIEVLENHLEHVPTYTSLSPNEEYLSYVTKEGIYMNHLQTGHQFFVPEAPAHLHNWNVHEMLLASSRRTRVFFRLTPRTKTCETVVIPSQFQDGALWFAALSPDGREIVYVVYQTSYTTKSAYLILQAVDHHEARILAQKANICDIRWSENGKYIAVAGVNRRGDPLNLQYDYHMWKGSRYHKEILDREGNVLWKG
jgi:hypothetical protein